MHVPAIAALLLLLAADAPVDTRPLPLKVRTAFEKTTWPGWSGADESGMPVALRPIVVTHAGDDSGRIFVAEQRGKVYVVPSESHAGPAGVFLDVTELVSYDDKTNEEGFLGMAFHPKFKENGQFFVYYTDRSQPHRNVVARYRVSADDPNVADPQSGEILLTMSKPFWNHDGGTIVFGPDGYLYIAVGDGGAANDPFENGQKLSTWLGKILRIDVDKKEDGKPYAIPADNPFVKQKNAKGEIWAYGLRNVWRMAFDPATGALWAGDVGQDTWEEIDLIVRGGNYGWNRREGFHPFAKSKRPSEASAEFVEPIFEYHHDVGKSITGGLVYRGKRIPELVGAYLYADYVTGKMWALRYDPKTQRVTANREIPLPQSIPVMTFGEDQQGEVYFTMAALNGQGIFTLDK
jgi:glucose/arabinose dehydrogenase